MHCYSLHKHSGALQNLRYTASLVIKSLTIPIFPYLNWITKSVNFPNLTFHMKNTVPGLLYKLRERSKPWGILQGCNECRSSRSRRGRSRSCTGRGGCNGGHSLDPDTWSRSNPRRKRRRCPHIWGWKNDVTIRLIKESDKEVISKTSWGQLY